MIKFDKRIRLNISVSAHNVKMWTAGTRYWNFYLTLDFHIRSQVVSASDSKNKRILFQIYIIALYLWNSGFIFIRLAFDRAVVMTM